MKPKKGNWERLPKWAQEEMRTLERQRDCAVKALERFCDNQTESPIYWDDLVCIQDGGPKSVRQYVQARSITVEHADVTIAVRLGERCITLQWGGDKYSLDEVAFIPEAFQSARLVHHRHLRVQGQTGMDEGREG
jgi:hypothetical protein